MNGSSQEQFSRADLKRVRVDEALKRKNKRRLLWTILVLAVLIVLVGGGILLSRSRSKNLPGVFVSDEGREHVSPGHPHTYNSNPPTSGPHFAQPAEWGIYKEELPDENLIHNLEHGGVWISYKPGISEEIRKKLEGFFEKYGRKIIVEPRSKNDLDIALVAWNRLDKFNASDFSEERVDRFIKAFRNKGPEFVP
ncbi:MAG: DUF3105 domain-containing protein [Candidatus Sungiibacteriota bacterium]|uniref:DUF3105 domain-containing protein n=1 Tax=Candidatus Sungiibacteriota bacterium TaxID=2750080 RepID=A0A7T5UR58_9BACT|nr:MAG: DUF3105 domain-containing protein [Candidatus Sungbacteria bacterium]